MDSAVSEDQRKELLKTAYKLEQQAQEIHELKIIVRTKCALEEDYKQEIQVLQQEVKEVGIKCEDWTAKRKAWLQKEKEYKTMLEENANKLIQHEQTISELKELVKKPDTKNDDAEVAALKADLRECREELVCMSDQHSKCASLKINVSQLEEEVEHFKQLYNHGKELCNELREENNTLKEELESMQEDVQSMRFEISTLKAKPCETSDSKEMSAQGNSLFTEVEDFRQAAMIRLKQAVEQEAHAKDELARSNLDLQRLRLQFSKLHEQFEKCQNLKLDYFDGTLRETHENNIEELKKRISELEAQVLKNATQIAGSNSYEWLQMRIVDYQKEVNDLHGQIHNVRMQLVYEQSSKITCSRQERCTMAENMKLKGKIMELTLENESLKKSKSPIKISNTNDKSLSSASGIENQPPKALKTLPWLANHKPVNAKQSVQFALASSSIGNNDMMQAKSKPKRVPYSMPTIHVPPPPAPASSSNT